MEISISKEILPSIEEYGFTETNLGQRRGSVKQYRNSSGLHAREYEDRFVIHRDSVDPRVDPIGHLVKDSPETILSFGAAMLLSRDKSKNHDLFNPLSFFLFFLSLNRILGTLKRLLR